MGDGRQCVQVPPQAMMQGVMQSGGLASFQEMGMSSSMGTTDPSVYQQPATAMMPASSVPIQYSQAASSAGQSTAPADAPPLR